jgi:outer membrane immunogenic protein
MRNIILSSIALFGALGSQTLAADLPPMPSARTPAMVVAERFSWSGVYAGINGGYGTGKVSDVNGNFASTLKGGLAGGQVGVNWQSDALVLGVEGDMQATWQKYAVTATVLGIPFTASRELPWFATARGRVGFAFDRAMIYATGGAAFMNYKVALTALGTTVSSDTTKAAWTAGGGWEWMFAEKWSAKAEYLYMDTGNTTVTLFGTTISGKGHNHVARAGINYHF